MNCRICMESIDLNEACGNICLCKEVYFHEMCAVKWFTPRIQGVSTGKAISNSWDTKWHAMCEVCQSKIDEYIVKKCITNLKQECFSKLQKTMNPLPNVPQSSRESMTSHPPRDLPQQQPSQRQIQRSLSVPVSSSWYFFGCFTSE